MTRDQLGSMQGSASTIYTSTEQGAFMGESSDQRVRYDERKGGGLPCSGSTASVTYQYDHAQADH